MTEEAQKVPNQADSAPAAKGKNFLANPWLRGVAIAAILSGLFLVSLPYGISFGLEKWFESIGATDVQVEDIDFNPFTGRLHVKNLDVTGERGGKIRMDSARFQFAWLPLWNKQFLLEAMSLQDGEMLLRREPEGGWVLGVIELTGADADSNPEAPSEWKVGLRQIDVGNTKVALALPKFQSEFQINKARIERAVAWEPENPANIDFDFTLDGAPLRLNGKIYPFRNVPEAEGHLKAEGVAIERYQALVEPAITKLAGSTSVDIQFKVVADEEFTLSKDGGVQVQGLALAGDGFDVSQQQLSWTGAVNLTATDTAQVVNGDGQLEFQGAKVVLAEQSIDQESLSYQGKFSVELKGEETMPAVSSEGALAGGQLSVNLPQTEMEITQNSVNWNGVLNLSPSDSGQMVEGDGELELVGTKVVSPEQSLDQEKLAYTGKFNLELGAEGGIPAVNTEGELTGGKLSVGLPKAGTELTQGGMTWNGKIGLAEESSGALSVTSDGRLEIDSIGIQLPDQSVEEGKLNWQGVATVSMAENPDESRVEAEGDLESGGISMRAEESGLSFSQSGMNWKGKVAVMGFGEAMAVNADGRMQAGETQFENPDLAVQQSSADWDGTVSFESQASGEPVITATGGLGLGASDVQLKREKLRFVHKSLRWDGQFGGEGASGGLKMDAVALTAPDEELVLVAADQVNLGGIKAPGPSSLDIGDIKVGGFAAGIAKGAEAGSGLARASAISANGLQWRAASHTTIDAVAIDSLQASLIRTAEGGWARVDALRSATGGAGSAPPASEAPSSAPTGDEAGSGAVAIGRISITGDSRLLYQDNAVNPAASFDLAIEEAQVGALDTRQPAQPTPLKLAGRLGADSRISAEGQIKPFAQPFEADLNGTISNLAVQSFSPYAADTISYELTKGRMTATMAFKTEAGKIEGDNQFIFNELEVMAVPGDEKKLTVPLETGLAMLRDKDDRIKLKVPVSGDLDNPDFSVADAINQALLKATQKAAVGYLALTLQPWGAVLLAADLAKDLGPGATASLDPVLFAAGSAKLGPEFNDYLDKLAKIVDERPGVQLRLCGRAVKADATKPVAAPAPPPPPAEEKSRWKKLFSKDEKKPAEAPPPATPAATDLVALAGERSTAVLNALVEKHKVPEERVYTCDPTPDPEDEGEPRVDVGI